MIFISSRKGNPDAVPLLELVGRGEQIECEGHHFTRDERGGIGAQKSASGK